MVFWFRVGNVQLVRVPLAGVPKAGVTKVGLVRVFPVIVWVPVVVTTGIPNAVTPEDVVLFAVPVGVADCQAGDVE